MNNKTRDVICLGRAAVDLYAEQRGCRLEDVQSFAKYLGGSSANLAVGLARLGLHSTMLTRVGNEQMGQFVRESLVNEGVDAGHVITDETHLTALVILGIRNQSEFPHIFFRENCADMMIDTADFDKEFIASSRSLAITGTHFSTDCTRQACRQAIDYARQSGTKVILDIDYRPVLWGLTTAAEGESRFISSPEVTECLKSFLPDCDLVVGTEEEICIAGGIEDILLALKKIRKCTDAIIVLKQGPKGCVIFDALEIPEKLEDGIVVQGFPVDVLNVLGAGDAFLSGFLYAWLNDKMLFDCGQYGNACGAIVVSRHGCTPAMPTLIELEDYLTRLDEIKSIAQDERLNYLHRTSTRIRDWDELYILAFDHRLQFEEFAQKNNIPLVKLSEFKQLVATGVEELASDPSLTGHIGILTDSRYGSRVLDRYTGNGWWVGRPVELPGSRPIQFEPSNNIGLHIRQWPQEHVVKCLVHYHPCDPILLRLQQEDQIISLYNDCLQLERELLIEIIPTSYGQTEDEHTVANIIRRFYNLGVKPAWWKLVPPSKDAWPHIVNVINECDPYCRGILLLGLDVPINDLQEGFRLAANVSLCKGFAIGRSIFWQAACSWLCEEFDDTDALNLIKHNYRSVIDAWQSARNQH